LRQKLIIIIYKLVLEFYNALGVIQKISPELYGYVRLWNGDDAKMNLLF